MDSGKRSLVANRLAVINKVQNAVDIWATFVLSAEVFFSVNLGLHKYQDS